MISSPLFCPNCCPRLEWGGVTGGHIWAHILREVLMWVTDPTCHRITSEICQDLFLFTISFSPQLDLLVVLWLHVVDKAYMWYSHAYIAFCTFVLDIVELRNRVMLFVPSCVVWLSYWNSQSCLYIYCLYVLCSEKFIVLKGIVHRKIYICWKRTPS